MHQNTTVPLPGHMDAGEALLRISVMCADLERRMLAVQNTLNVGTAEASDIFSGRNAICLQDLDHISQSLQSLANLSAELATVCTGRQAKFARLEEAAHLNSLQTVLRGENDLTHQEFGDPELF